LRSGQLQLLRLDNPSDYIQLSHTPGIQTFTEPSSNFQVLFVSPVVPPFNTLAMRQALRAAIDRPALVTKVWGPLATPSTQMLQAGLLPNGAAPDPIQYDPTALRKAVAGLPPTERSLTMAYNSGALPDERMGEALVAVLSAAGLHVNLKAEPFNASWWKPHPPSLFINLGNSDTSNADTWLRPYATSKAGLNPLQVGSPVVDKFVNLGFASSTQTAAIANYAAAARALEVTATVITLADVADAWAATTNLHGWSAAPAFPASLFVNKATLGVTS
jgi:peptide/nickel transport system substrate-binding protein